MKNSKNNFALSLIVPVFNEEDTVDLFCEKIQSLIPDFKECLNLGGKGATKEWLEILFINDGSEDKTQQILDQKTKKHPYFRCITFSRNFGQQAAVSAGILHARGSAVVVMDVDLQDPPELVKDMIGKWQEGYAVVYAIRQKRQAPLMLNLAYKLYYVLNSIISDYPVYRDSGDFCLLDRKVVEVINKLPEKDRYMRGLRTWVGFKQIGVEYDRKSRQSGNSKYSFVSLVKLAFQGILATSVKPLFLSGVFCVIALFVIIGMIAIVLFAKIIMPEHTIPVGWASIMITVLFFSGAQLLSIWLLSLYISRIYSETISRPTYVIENDTLGVENMT